MRARDPARSLETYLCGIWADSARRAAWKAGFAAIGQVPAVRATFDGLYKSASLDGGKIATFFRAYAANGLQPTEIDYGFFKDPAAHPSPSLAPIQQAIANLLAAQPSAARWKVRQAIALNVRPGSRAPTASAATSPTSTAPAMRSAPESDPPGRRAGACARRMRA